MWTKLNTSGNSDGGSTPIVDNLTSTSTTSALSANQGKVLDDKIVSLEKGQLTVNTLNLFDKTKVDTTGYWLPSGASVSKVNTSSYQSSDFIPCNDGEVFSAKASTTYVTYWNDSKVYVSGGSISGNTWTVPTGTGIKYFRVSIEQSTIANNMIIKGVKNDIPFNYIPYQQTVSVIPSSFNGKWLAMGDSITYGQNLSAAEYATKSYTAIANKTLKMDLRNIGYPGAAMTKRNSLDNYSFIELSKGVYNSLTLDFNDYDVLTVAYGTNDYGFNSGTGVPLGTDVNSIDETTFYGAMNVGIQNILSGKVTSNPKLKIVFILPIFRTSADTASPPINANGHSLQNYRDAIIAVCKKWKIPHIDAYNGLGMNSLNHTVFMDDGLHPIEAGHRRYGEFLAGQMLSLGLN